MDTKPVETYNLEKWFEEEYKILQQNYYHEDSLILKFTTYYSTINIGILSFIGSQFSLINSLITKYLLPSIGVILSINWLIKIIRQKEIRDEGLKRMQAVEEYLHSVWDKQQFKPLNSFSYKDWKIVNQRNTFKIIYSLFRIIPVSYTILIMPIIFTFTWIIILLC